MNRTSHPIFARLLASLVSTTFASAALAQPSGEPPRAAPPSAGMATDAGADGDFRKRDRWYFQTSLYTRHFSPSPDHVNHNKLLNLERQRGDDWLAGLALFRNSFGQPTQYLYLGKQWRPFESMPNVHVKLTGGLLHGYKDQYKDKIPLNHWGTAPALLPSIGWSNRRFGTDLILFGTAGLMWTGGVYFD